MLREQFDFLHLFRNLPGIVNDDLFCFFRAEIGEFLQHLVRRLEVQRRLQVRVGKFHAGLDNRPADSVFRIHKMHVARGHYRDIQFFAKFDNFPVQVPQFFLGGSLSVPQHEGVIADGLNLQVVVEGRNLLDPFMVFPVHHSPEQFTCLAGAAQDQALPVLLDHVPGHMRHTLEIVQVADGYQPVQVHQAGPVLRQQDNVPAFSDGTAGQCGVQVFFAYDVRMFLPGFLKHALQAVGCCRCVMHRPVGVLQADTQVFAQRGQAEGFQVRIQFPGIAQRIHHRHVQAPAQSFQFRLQQACVKVRVVCRNGQVADKFHQLRQCFLCLRLPLQHNVVDSGNVRDLRPQRFSGIHQLLKAVDHCAAFQLYGADFNNPGLAGIQARAFKVQHHHRSVVRPVVRILKYRLLVNQISFAAGNQLNLSLGRPESCRVGLQHAVVCHGYGRMSPVRRTLDQLINRRQRVHGGHIGMHMELDPLFLRGVHPLLFFCFHQVPHGDAQVPGKIVIQALAANLDAHAFLDPVHLFPDGCPLFVGNRRSFGFFLLHVAAAIAEKHLAQDGTGIVGHRKGYQQHFAALQFLLLQFEYFALDHDQAAVAFQLLDLHRPVRYAAADDRFADRLCVRAHRR